METDSRPTTTVEPLRSAGLLDKGPRAALAVFVMVEAIGLCLYLWFGRDQWFWSDEWEFLARRSGTSLRDLLEPYHDHWVGGPLVVYRALWSVFGLRTYLPYQLVAVSTHLGIAALLRVVMRRADVAPWIATASAGALVLFGTGEENIVWGFQIAFTGAILFGIVHMLLANHEGRVDWRDPLGLVAGVIALSCSGVGVVMILAVGCSTLLRRGVRRAALHVAPLVAVFGVWWFVYGGSGSGDRSFRPSLVLRFVLGGAEATLHSLGQLAGTSWLLVLLLVVGLALAWRRLDRAEVRWRAAEPMGLLLGAIVFLAFTGWARAPLLMELVGSLAYVDRYRYVVAALVLPAFAVAVDALARRWRAGGIIVLVPLLLGLPHNVNRITTRDADDQMRLGQRDLFAALADSTLLDEVPGSVRPFPVRVGEDVVTVDWIRQARDSGRLPPAPEGLSQAVRESARLRLSIEQRQETRRSSTCRPFTEPMRWRPEIGSSLYFEPSGRPWQVTVTQAIEGSDPVSVGYNLFHGRTLTAVAGQLDVTIVPQGVATVCE